MAITRPLKLAFSLATLLSVLGVLVIFGGLTLFETRAVQSRLQDKINQSIPGSLHWKSLNFSLLRGRVTLKGLELKDPQERHLAGFDRLEVDLSWLGLLSKDVVVEAFILDKPTLRLSVDTSGALNLLSAFPPASEEAPEEKEPSGELPVNIIVKHFKISEGDVSYRQAADTLEAAVHGLSLVVSGDYKRRKGEVEFKLEGGALSRREWKLPLEKLSLNAQLQDGSLAPLELKFAAGQNHLKLEGTADSLFTTPVLNQTLEAQLQLEELVGYLPLEEVTGLVRLKTEVTGTLDDPSLRLALEYSGGTLFSNEVRSATLDLSLKDHIANLDSLTVKSGDLGDLRLQGLADLQAAFPGGFLDSNRFLDSISYAVNFRQHGLDLSSLTPDSIFLKGEVESFFNLTGKGVDVDRARATVDLSARINSLTAMEKAAPQTATVKLLARLGEGALALENLSVAMGKIALTAKGNYHLQKQKPNLELTLLAPTLGSDLQTLGIDSLQGSLKAEASLTGSLSQPEAQLILEMDELAFKTTGLGSLKLDAALNNEGLLRISKLSLRNRESMFHLSGEAHVLHDGRPLPVDSMRYSIEIRDTELRLEDFLDSLSGTLSLAASLQGRGLKPVGNLDLRGKQLDLGVEPLEIFELKVETAQGDIHVKPLRITLSSGEFLELRGSTNPWNKTYDILLESPGISTAGLKSLAMPDSTQATLSLKFAGKGTYGDPRMAGALKLRKIAVRGEHLPDIELNLDLSEQVARLRGEPGFGIHANYHLENRDFDARLIFKNTPLARYFKLAGRHKLAGTLSGQVDVSGNAKAVEKIQAEVNFQSLDLQYQAQPLIRSEDLHLLYQDGKLNLQSFNLTLLEAGHFSVSGSGPLKGPYGFRLEGDVPLKVARPFIPDLYDLSGNLQLTGSLEGTSENPDFRVVLDLKKVEMTVPVLLQKLQKVNGRITADSRSLEISNLRGMLDDGAFELNGKSAIEAFKPGSFDLSFEANNLPLKIPGMLSSRWDAKISAAGDTEKSGITGDLTLIDGLYYKDVEFNLLELGKKSRKSTPAQPEDPPPFIKNMALNLNINHREELKVDNNVAKLNIRPDVTVSGNAASPGLNGRATISSGRILFQNKEFVVTEGYIDFLNPYEIEPTLFIVSQVSVREGTWIITLKLQGTPDNLQFSLSSNPALEDEDIISLLVTGRTAKEIRDGQLFSGGGSSRQMLKQALAGVMASQLKARSGLDEVKIETLEEDGEKNGSDVKVTLGKQLTRRLATKYAVETEEGKVIQKAIAEYKLLESLLMSGFQDTEGVYGGEIQVYLEFR